MGVLSKNIKIVSGADSGWGFRLVVNSFLDGTIARMGHIVLQGVELDQGGQYDTEYAVASLMTVMNP